MARDERQLGRLYGEPPARRPVPVGPAIWGIGLVVGAVVSLGLGVAALVALARPDPLQQDLETWGVLSPDERWVAWHDHSDGLDHSSGCALVGDQVVRWDGKQPTGRLDLPGARVELDHGVRVRGAGNEVYCPFGVGEGADAFAALLRARTEVPEPWHPADPRLQDR